MKELREITAKHPWYAPLDPSIDRSIFQAVSRASSLCSMRI